jgi:5'-methylthioadenosine phosphorylase/purine-nucleoside phosphorylase
VPIHLRAEPGDYASAVLCPGDPRRATYIAETFLDPGARLVNQERGMLGYTGTFEDTPLSVQSTGMGCPSAGIVYEELVQLGATRLVRVGTCGAIAPGLAMADTVIGISASPVDTTALQLSGMTHAPTATFALAEAAARLSREAGATVHVGPIVSSSLFYDPDPENIERWQRLGHLGIEMEAAMLYTVAAVHGIESLAMMAVSDLVTSTESVRISDEDLRRGVDAMMLIACRVAVVAS